MSIIQIVNLDTSSGEEESDCTVFILKCEAMSKFTWWTPGGTTDIKKEIQTEDIKLKAVSGKSDKRKMDNDTAITEQCEEQQDNPLDDDNSEASRNAPSTEQFVDDAPDNEDSETAIEDNEEGMIPECGVLIRYVYKEDQGKQGIDEEDNVTHKILKRELNDSMEKPEDDGTEDIFKKNGKDMKQVKTQEVDMMQDVVHSELEESSQESQEENK